MSGYIFRFGNTEGLDICVINVFFEVEGREMWLWTGQSVKHGASLCDCCGEWERKEIWKVPTVAEYFLRAHQRVGTPHS